MPKAVKTLGDIAFDARQVDNVAYFLAAAVRCSYSQDQQFINRWKVIFGALTNQRWTTGPASLHPDADFLVFPDCLVISIAGSTEIQQLIDYVRYSAKDVWHPGITDELVNSFLLHLADDAWPFVAAQINQYPGKNVVFCGHSLGAALCQLAARKFIQQFPDRKCVSFCFGCPTVGNEAFGDRIYPVNYNYINELDPIPHFPWDSGDMLVYAPGWVGTIIKYGLKASQLIEGLYEISPKIRVIHQPPDLRVQYLPAAAAGDGVFAAFQFVGSFVLWQSWPEHSIKKYCELLGFLNSDKDYGIDVALLLQYMDGLIPDPFASPEQRNFGGVYGDPSAFRGTIPNPPGPDIAVPSPFQRVTCDYSAFLGRKHGAGKNVFRGHDREILKTLESVLLGVFRRDAKLFDGQKHQGISNKMPILEFGDEKIQKAVKLLLQRVRDCLGLS